ncbi:SbcC/MukB-like Walker B domain-containing protein [Clostridium gasigenes]|uniref:SbcC/MukB-like Walker B domain-containing protein n=1 Tax=Clostridium gasigenes TaxID=94869 RepID=UPI001C0C417E|nr:SbcC/MukB-like Walker B domain-containing protein [Clostridium gasigenes]MBU3103990.1 hypothetical protein [Clostridium gasigenes]
MSSRWVANKFGLFNFWYYDDQEYKLENGKIIFKGTNGSGKSVTTQSFIPLLLDGDKRPNRIDPFGTKSRRIEDYILMEDGEEDRISYLYMEFKKPKSKTYITIGIGFRARKGKKLENWHFILKDGRRINKDFKLYEFSGEKIPLNQKKFENRLGEGNVFTLSQKEYMNKVNEHLFGYSDIENYKELLNLLIELRSPKLSKDFKPTKIYGILNKSLNTLSEDDLRDISEAMDNMDSLNNNLEELDKSLRSAEKIYNAFSKYNKTIIYKKGLDYNRCRLRVKNEADSIDKLYKENSAAEILKEVSKEEIKELKLILQDAKIKRKALENHKGFKISEKLVELKNENNEVINLLENKKKSEEDKLDKKRKSKGEIEGKELKIYNIEKVIKGLLDDEEYYREKSYYESIVNIKNEISLKEDCSLDLVLENARSYEDLIGTIYKLIIKLSEAKKELDKIFLLEHKNKREVKELDRKLNEGIELLTTSKIEYIEKINRYLDKCKELKIKDKELNKLFRTIHKVEEIYEANKIEFIIKGLAEEKLMNLKDENIKLNNKNECKDNEIKELESEIIKLENNKESIEEEENVKNLKKEKLLITQSITHIEVSIFTITNEIDNFPKVNDIETSITLIDEAKRKLKDGESLLKIIRDQLFEKERDKEKLDSRIIEEGEYIKIPKNLEAFEEAVESIKLYIEAINNLKYNHNNKSHIEKEIKSTKDIIEDINFDIDIIISEIHGLKGKREKISAEIQSLEEILKSLNLGNTKEELNSVIHITENYPDAIEVSRESYIRNKAKIEVIQKDIIKSKDKLEKEKKIFKYYKKILNDEISLGYIEEIRDLNEEEAAIKILESDGQGLIEKKDRIVSKLFETISQYGSELVEYNLKKEDIFLDYTKTEDEEINEILSGGIRIDLMFKINRRNIKLIDLINHLVSSIEEQKLLISDKEREIFEDTLINTLSSKISAKIYNANKWVKQINALMSSMDTSNGLKLDLKWIAKKSENIGELGSKELTKIIGNPQFMDADEREKLSNHFKESLKKAKKLADDEDINKSYQAIIKEVLDYREWYEFRLSYSNNKSSKLNELTDNEFFKLSGGEKAMAMYIPLFAAINARYNAADKKDCPRIIALDEAFAGVDEQNINTMFTLLEGLDLDYVLNSQVLWGTYESVKSLIIYELIRQGDDVILPIKYKWNGKVKSIEGIE